MRGPTPDQILSTEPPDLRAGTKVTQTILDMRRRILTGTYQAGESITTKNMKDKYGLNNMEMQSILLHLAIEGLIKIVPVKEKIWPNNAAVNEYYVADFNGQGRMFSTRQGGFVSDIAKTGHQGLIDTLELEVQYADEEVAALLRIAPNEPVIFHRNIQKRDKETIVAISDTYIPFWFAPVLPELRKTDFDIYKLMRQLGKEPSWCTETIDVVQASSVERRLFELSSDDPTALLKILRRSFEKDGTPLDVQFLTDRSDTYRLHYSFPLFAEDIPEAVRDK